GPMFFLDSVDEELHQTPHECGTVMEEDEDDENESIESSAVTATSIASSSEYSGSTAPPTRPSMEISNEKPSSTKRRRSSRIASLFKRSSPSNGTVQPVEATNPVNPAHPGALRSTRSFFSSRGQRTPSFNASQLIIDTNAPQRESNGAELNRAPRTGRSETFGPFAGRADKN